MTKHIQDTNLATTWHIDTDADEWVLAQTAKISTSGEPAVEVADGSDHNAIRLWGDIKAVDTTYTMRVDGDDNSIVIGKAGLIDGRLTNVGLSIHGTDNSIVNHGVVKGDTSGILLQGSGATLVSDGTVVGKSNGIFVSGSSAAVTNSGSVAGTVNAVSVSGNDLQLVNEEGGIIDGGFRAFNVSGDGTKITNHGSIKGQYVIDDAAGDTHIVNRGSMTGIVSLGDGADRFDTRFGTFDGVALGGGGDDTFLVSRADIALSEDNGSGFDTVVSTVSFTLADNIERLYLSGSKAINGYGNGADNSLYGNVGANHLFGKTGGDNLDGKAGNDMLTGGIGEDIFVFNKNADHDTVTDFKNGVDVIQSTYADTEAEIDLLLSSHATQTDAGVLIKFGDDQLLLKGMDIDKLDASDFFVWI